MIDAITSKLRVVGEYILSPNEELSQDGSYIICKVCGKRKYESRYSRLFGLKVWWNANNESQNDIDVGEGCDCIRDARRISNEAWCEYESPKFEFDKDGKILSKIHDRRDFSREYNFYDWMLSAVPSWGRTAQIEDRFYFQDDRYTTPVQVMRLLLDSLDLGCDWREDIFIYGSQGTLKTSMLCCLRFALYSKCKPVIMVNIRQVIAFIARVPSFAEQLEKVEYLIIDDIGKATLTDRQSGMLEALIKARAGKPTMYASSKSLEGLSEKGYGKGVLDLMKLRLASSYIVDMDGRV